MKNYLYKLFATFLLSAFSIAAHTQASTAITEPLNVRVTSSATAFTVSWDIPLIDPDDNISGYKASAIPVMSKPPAADIPESPYGQCFTISKTTTTCTINVKSWESLTYNISVRAFTYDSNGYTVLGPASTSMSFKLSTPEPVPTLGALGLIGLIPLVALLASGRIRRHQS